MPLSFEELVQQVRLASHRGYTHVFLGHPLSDGCDKTTVEPGNVFSPGVWTCGISIWVEVDGQLFAPELMPNDEIAWQWDTHSGFAPVLEARYACGASLSLENRLTHHGGAGSEGADFCQIQLKASVPVQGRVFITVRDIGPAGGKLNHLAWNEAAEYLELDGGARLTVERQLTHCYIAPSDEHFDAPAALLGFEFSLFAGEDFQFSFTVEHGFQHRAFGGSIPLQRPHLRPSAAKALNTAWDNWQQSLPARIFCPDHRVEDAWNACAYHIQAAMEGGLPRIGAVNYPVFWIRDGVLVLRALDVIGRHDLARQGCDYLSTLDFGGGFGAESDAPGEGIWALCKHAQITGDWNWLRKNFTHIERRTTLILEMCRTTEPLYRLAENRLPAYQNSPGINLLCFPARNGLIHGRMDWHSPDFYINCWALCGLQEAATLAEVMQYGEIAADWWTAALELERALAKHLLPEYGNPRDPIVTPHPTCTLIRGSHEERLKQQFLDWFKSHRLNPDGSRKPEVVWTYFEAAQIHNAILLGFKDEAWTCLNGMLDDGDKTLWSYIEGRPSGNEYLPYENGRGHRGWLDPETARGGNMPHNWTSAELLLAIRSVFVVEDQSVLQIGLGVPREWLKPGATFGVQNLPTKFGPVSYLAKVETNGQISLKFEGKASYVPCWGR